MNYDELTKEELIELCQEQKDKLNKLRRNITFDEHVDFDAVFTLCENSFCPILRAKVDGSVIYSNQAAHFFVHYIEGKKYLIPRFFRYVMRALDTEKSGKFKYIDERNYSFIIIVDQPLGVDYINIYCISLEDLRLDSDVLRAVVGQEFTRYTENIESVGTIELDLTTSLARKSRLFCELNNVPYTGDVVLYNLAEETKNFHPDDVEAYYNNMEDIFTGELLGFESIYRVRINNTYAWRKANFHIRSNPNILIGSVEDIDIEQRQGAEVAFLNSVIKEASFNSDFFYWCANFDGTFEISDSFEHLTGLPLTSSHEDFIKHIYPDDVQKYTEFVEHEYEELTERELEYRFIREDRRLLYFRARIFNRFNDIGEVIGRVGMMVDITSHVVASERLRVNEYLLRDAVKSAGMGYWIHRVNTGELYFSDVFSEIFELQKTDNQSVEDYIHKLLSIVHPDDKAALLQQRREFLQSREVERVFNFRILKSSGEVRWLRLMLCVEKNDIIGDLYRFGTVIDVTQQHKYEETLEKERADAINANKAKSAFLATMSHEIRTPLNAIIGFSSILNAQPLKDKEKKYARAINTSAESLLSILNNVLDFSKIEAKKLVLSPTLLNLDDFVNELNTIFGQQAINKNLKFMVRVNQQGFSIFIDSARLRQIMMNIISNAFKFTEDGFVYVNFCLHINEDGQSVDLIVTVSDSGIGISEKDQANIFNAFEQSENQDIRKYGGTGLGLAISRNLVELMNGSIEVESAPNIGTKFTVSFPEIPLSDAERHLKSYNYTRRFQKVKSRAVVIEKKSEKLDNICYYLSALDYKTYRFTSVSESLKFLRTTTVDLIITEFLDAGGWNDLVVGAHELDRHRNTPIIAVSSDMNAKKKYDLSVFETVLYRPVVFSKLSNAIESIKTNTEKPKTEDHFRIERTALLHLRERFLDKFIQRHKLFSMDYDLVLSKELMDYAHHTQDPELFKFAEMFKSAVDAADLKLLNELSMLVLDNV